MKVTSTTRHILAIRRERRMMERAGYRHIDLTEGIRPRGVEYDHKVTDIRLSRDGKSIYFSLQPPPKPAWCFHCMKTIRENGYTCEHCP
jgi:hypothetical protein